MKNHYPLDRRTFLVAGGLGFFGMNLANAAAYADTPGTRRGAAKSTIMIWLSGGASHIDSWDMKPAAPAEYRGPFQPVATSTPGVMLCEHLPHTARQAHHLAVVRSLGDFHRGTGDHHAGYYTNLTGHSPDPTFHRLLNARTPYPTDDAHGLTLVKLVSPDQPLFSWLKCRSGSPATGQRLQFFDAERQPRGVSAVEAGQPLP